MEQSTRVDVETPVERVWEVLCEVELWQEWATDGDVGSTLGRRAAGHGVQGSVRRLVGDVAAKYSEWRRPRRTRRWSPRRPSYGTRWTAWPASLRLQHWLDDPEVEERVPTHDPRSGELALGHDNEGRPDRCRPAVACPT